MTTKQDEQPATCAYCDMEIPETDRLVVPRRDDDDEWGRLARQHAEGCEWIATRAHRIDPDRPTDE